MYFIDFNFVFSFLILLKLTNKFFLAKMQNWPFNFQYFSFQSSNFQFCYSSPLTFNFVNAGFR